jgi:UDP-galactopyranose mutase
MMLPTDSRALPDILCLSHLRWSFVYQRPQHLMTRYARATRVFYVEEPVFVDVREATYTLTDHEGVFVIVPALPATTSAADAVALQRELLDQMTTDLRIAEFVLWYYTPTALSFSSHLQPVAVVYDCMDELASFKGASRWLPVLERVLFERADVVFTGGWSLYEAKRQLHRNVHALPSSVDIAHFAIAQRLVGTPVDQAIIPTPRLGFFGVLDERLDIDLLRGIARARPDWHWVMVGPTVKIDPAELPKRPNIHYLGPKTYAELPAYIAGWDVALMPFARNDATRFISPTKTPEYLAAGKPVVSTSIADVVQPYGARGLVRIADTVQAFVAACEGALAEPPEPHRVRARQFLRGMSWECTWARSAALLAAVLPSAAQVPSTAPADMTIGA